MKEVKDNVREFLNAVKNGTATEFYIDEFLNELHNENKLKRFYKSVFVDVVVYRSNETDKFFKVDMTNVECCHLEKLCSIIEKSYPYVMLAEQPQQIEIEQERLKSLDDISKMSINDISKYIDDTFGVVSPDDCMKHDKRYYYDYDIDEATGEKMEFIERARGILLQIKHINETLNKTPDYNSRKALKQSREALYTEYKTILEGRQPKTDTGTPNPLLSNQQFLEILERAKQKRFIVVDKTGKYKPKNLVWLAVFADELDRMKITSTKFADIERLFNTSLLKNKLQKAISQKNYDSMRLEITSLID